MTFQEIQKAIIELSPNELARFREWFKKFDAQTWNEEFESNAKTGELDKAKTEEYLKKLQGSLKDRGGLKTLAEDREGRGHVP